MPQYIDSYYLTESRDLDLVYKFLNDFLPQNKEVAIDYPVPQFGNDKYETIFYNVKDLLIYLEQNMNVDYIIYWESLTDRSTIKQVTVQYTDDGKSIFGVSISGREADSEESISVFNEIKKYLNSNIGCITGEEPPPSNSAEFIEFCENRFIPV